MAMFYNHLGKEDERKLRLDPDSYLRLRTIVIHCTINYINVVDTLPVYHTDVAIMESLKKENLKLKRHRDKFIQLTCKNKPPRRLDNHVFTCANLLGLILFIEKREVYEPTWKYSRGQVLDMYRALCTVKAMMPARNALLDSFIDFLGELDDGDYEGCYFQEE